MVTDSIGKQIGHIVSFPTKFDPEEFVKDLGVQVRKALLEFAGTIACDGIGIVIPGMLDRKTGIVLHAPTLRWRNVNLVDPLKRELEGTEIHLENSGKACALSQIWSTRADGHGLNDLVYVSVSDGVGVGVVMNGELVRGKAQHRRRVRPRSAQHRRSTVLLRRERMLGSIHLEPGDAVPAISDATSACVHPQSVDVADFTIEDLITRARGNDSKALTALHSTARYLGLGLASIINSIDPSQIYIGGEITEGWDLIEAEVRAAIKERALTIDLGEVPIRIVPAVEYPRLRGAVALVTAPAFAAPKVA
jgi:predicted NBD/HSP70 family sugar kinase